MKIEVKNTKLLWLYRTFLFKKVEFITNDKNLEVVVNALNIKERKMRITYVYDEAVKYINNYYADDLCKFENGQCIVQRKRKTSDVNGCCRRCPLVTDKGCPSSNLACKLIYCKTALGNFKLLKLSEITVLKCLSIFQRIVLRGCFFSVRDEILKYLYYGFGYSMICFFIKDIKVTVYRIRNRLY